MEVVGSESYLFPVGWLFCVMNTKEGTGTIAKGSSRPL